MTDAERELLLILAEARAQQLIRERDFEQVPKISRLMGRIEAEHGIKEREDGR